MSLVGPYKIPPDGLHHDGTRRFSVVTLKPGMIDMAQVQ
jgi:lipopolysaccharide/colanic/teichoic acid biosynthesis glycosyltransferase